MGLKNLYVFGNVYIENDNFALKVAENIKKRRIIHCSSPDLLLDKKEKEIIILDVAKNINKPAILDSSRLKLRKITSLHDFDLGFFLNLIKKLNIDKNIKIIGVPKKGNAKSIAKEVEKWI